MATINLGSPVYIPAGGGWITFSGTFTPEHITLIEYIYVSADFQGQNIVTAESIKEGTLYGAGSNGVDRIPYPQDSDLASLVQTYGDLPEHHDVAPYRASSSTGDDLFSWYIQLINKVEPITGGLVQVQAYPAMPSSTGAIDPFPLTLSIGYIEAIDNGAGKGWVKSGLSKQIQVNIAN